MKNIEHTTFLLLGGNLGNRAELLQKAQALINTSVGVITQASSIYETAAWGNTQQPNFLNQVVQVRTWLSAEELLLQIQTIEQQLGRQRHEHWGARTMDIDILLYDQLILDTATLVIPHALLAERRFVLVPLVEIAGEILHPVWLVPLKDLLAKCPDTLLVSSYP